MAKTEFSWDKQSHPEVVEGEEGVEIEVKRVMLNGTEYIDVRKCGYKKDGTRYIGKGCMVPAFILDEVIEAMQTVAELDFIGDPKKAKKK